MRDWLPEEARTVGELARRVLACFELYGYQRVTLPVFEYADVFERGLGALDASEVLRFVEPESGELVAIRPDMTPQVARLVTSRLRDAPLPARLCYEGSVVRLRRERARRRRQVPQAGIELVGAPARAGDLEMLGVAVDAVRAAGLADFVLDLSHARVAGSLVEAADPEHRLGLVEALSLRDRAGVAGAASRAGLAQGVRAALVALLDHDGSSEVAPEVRRALDATPAAEALEQLDALALEVLRGGLAARLFLNLGEVRHLAYYTGVQFQILAEGPGEAVASGGRYDGLFAKFGAARPAAGFAVDLDNLAWAVGGQAPAEQTRVLLDGGEPTELLALATRLRARGRAVVIGGDEGYARAWGFSHRVQLGAAWVVCVLASGQQQELTGSTEERVEGLDRLVAGGVEEQSA